LAYSRKGHSLRGLSEKKEQLRGCKKKTSPQRRKGVWDLNKNGWEVLTKHQTRGICVKNPRGDHRNRHSRIRVQTAEKFSVLVGGDPFPEKSPSPKKTVFDAGRQKKFRRGYKRAIGNEGGVSQRLVRFLAVCCRESLDTEEKIGWGVRQSEI